MTTGRAIQPGENDSVGKVEDDVGAVDTARRQTVAASGVNERADPAEADGDDAFPGDFDAVPSLVRGAQPVVHPPIVSANGEAPSVGGVQDGAIGFRSRAAWMSHYDKHGAEFGRPGPNRYLELAQALRDAPVGGAVIERVRGDGAISRFDRSTGAFVTWHATTAP